MEQSPTMALELIVQNNPAAVRANLMARSIAVANNHGAIYNAVAKLLNSGRKDEALAILSVPVIVGNLPDGYQSELTESGYLPETPADYGQQPYEEEDFDFEDTTGGGGTTTTNNAAFQWGDFFGFASEIIVGLWGTQPYGNYPGGYYPEKNNTGLYVTIGALVIVVLAVLFISVRKK